MFLQEFFKHNKKNYFLTFWILQHVCKTPKGIGQYFKKYKNLILGRIHILFTANVWIKKSQVVNIQNNFIGIISHHTSLKEALI